MSINTNFIDEVQNSIASQSADLTVENADISGNLQNFVVKSPKGAKILVELQDAKSYGELPLSTAVQLNKIKQLYPSILLVSLSEISGILRNTLENLGISYLVKPSVDDVSKKINEMAKL